MTNRASRYAAALLTTGALTLWFAPTATADTTTRQDPTGDAIPRFDITKVRYTNGPQLVRGRLRVPALQRRGAAKLVVSREGTDSAYEARVRIVAGDLRKRFVLVGDLGTEPRHCDFTARWNAAEGYIRIVVPQHCVAGFGSGPAYLTSHTGGEHGDFGPVVRHLARG